MNEKSKPKLTNFSRETVVKPSAQNKETIFFFLILDNQENKQF